MKFVSLVIPLLVLFVTPYQAYVGKRVGKVAMKTGRTSLEDYLKECWEAFVNSMSTGIPELNIPTFDPWFSVDSFPFRMQDSSIALRADVNATNVESLGLSSVQIPSIIEISDSRYNVSLTLPDMELNGIYSVVGSHHYFYPIVGNGPFSLTLRNVWSSGTTSLLYNGTVYSITKLELEPLEYGSAASEYFNLSISGTDSTSETTSQIVNALTETLWFQVEEQLRLQLSDSVTQYLNDQLLDYKPTTSLFDRNKKKFGMRAF